MVVKQYNPYMNSPISQIVRGYELKERLGQGGFGAVYRAYQQAIDREVAIKVILPQYASRPEFVRRFEAEAQLIARLEHPHIVPLYDFWRDPAGAYLVMRYLRGGNLRTLLKNKKLGVDEALECLREIASALDAAHRQNIIHRDVKPDNILLDENGNAYLSDFGIAQMLKRGEKEGASEETLSGSMGYISPEQARGEAISARSDIYSLGVIAYELLTGKHPFDGESPTVQMIKHLTELLPPIIIHRSDLPSAVDEVIQRATAKDANERYASAGEFIHALALSCEIGSSLLPTSLSPSKPIPAYITNPYKGLHAFEESDAGDFFGREKLIHTLVERLETPTLLGVSMRAAGETEPYRFLAVVGPSGSGKSSVVKAGVIPALRRGFISGSDRWLITTMTPGYNPLQQLEQELLTIASQPFDQLAVTLRANPDGLKIALPHLLHEKSEVLLVIDQFEEVFASAVNEEERALFLESIQRAVNYAESQLRVIITLRADFYDRPLAYAGFGKLLQRRTEVVLPLTPNELADAILNPAERMGVTIERSLALEIAAEVTDQPGALPLLQYALTELFDRREDEKMTRAAYQSLGGVMGALTRRAEEVYRSMQPAEQQTAKILFQRLVTLGEGTEDTRRRTLRGEVDHLAPSMGRVIDAFGQARLISFDRDSLTRAPTIEVTHEAIIRQWKTLREWLNENRESIRMQQHITQAAQAWVAGNRDPGDLYRGLRLSQLREWAEDHLAELNLLEREFLHASIGQEYEEAKEKERQQLRELETLRKLADSEKQRAEEKTLAAGKLQTRGRYLAAALSASLILLLVAAWMGYQANEQRKQAQESFLHSEQLRLAAESTSLLLAGSDIETAPLLSIASLRMGYTEEADSALQRAMTYTYPTFTLSEHQGSIYAVRFSPDGRTLATTSTDKTAIVWDAQTGKVIHTLAGHTDTVACLDFSPDGKILATGSDDLTIRLWDVASGELLLTLEGPEDVIWALSYAPDGRHIAATSYDQTLRIWDTESGEEVANYPLVTTASGIAYAPDGKAILTAGDDNIARLYSASTGEVLQEFKGHSLPIISVAYSHDGKYVATGSNDKTARIWDAQTGQELMRLIGHQESIYGINFSSDSRYVFTGGYDRVAMLWDRESGIRIRQFIGHRSSLYSSAISPDDRWVLTGSFDGTARLWDSGISPNPRALLHTGSVIGMALNPNKDILATGTSNGDVHLWNTATGQEIHSLMLHTDAVESIAFSPDGQWLASAADDYTVAIWSVREGALIRQISGFGNIIWSIRFGPDNRTLLVGGTEGLSLWDAQTGEQIQVFDQDNEYYAVTISPDGQIAMGGGYHGLCFYYIESGEKIDCPQEFADTSLYALDFSPTENLLAAAGRDIYLIDFTTRKQIRSLQGHTGTVPALRFSSNGEQLISGSEDGSARLWDVASGRQLRVFTNRNALVNNVAFAGGNQQVYIGGADNMVWLMDITSEKLIELACQTLTHRLTEEERLKYKVLPEIIPCP